MPVTCPYCSKKFANSNSLSTHRNKYHPDLTKMNQQDNDDGETEIRYIEHNGEPYKKDANKENTSEDENGYDSTHEPTKMRWDTKLNKERPKNEFDTESESEDESDEEEEAKMIYDAKLGIYRPKDAFDTKSDHSEDEEYKDDESEDDESMDDEKHSKMRWDPDLNKERPKDNFDTDSEDSKDESEDDKSQCDVDSETEYNEEGKTTITKATYLKFLLLDQNIRNVLNQSLNARERAFVECIVSVKSVKEIALMLDENRNITRDLIEKLADYWHTYDEE